ncbi:MAG TPA: SAM-dependent methyltransferase [Methylococcaceae bacterium]|nr:SAM-dependent methyltransferase [Methylococcaceae bacterium]
MNTEKPSTLFLCSVALISASALAYEILLMRLFSIVQWHHFAYMMISLALLGFGASGTFLTLARNFLLPRFTAAFTTNASLLGLSSALCFLAAQTVPFNALEILWSASEWRKLIFIYLLLIPPFFFAANCVGLAFQHFKDDLGRIYAADLLGSGLGALGVVLLLFLAFPLTALRLIGGGGLIAAALGWLGLGGVPRQRAALLAAAAPILWVVLSLGGAELKPVEYKGLAQTLQVIGASKLAERSSPLGLLTVVQSPTIPFRYAPGLSLNSPGEVPEQLAVFTDGDGMSVINRYSGDPKTLTFLDYIPSALPYHLLPRKPYVLVLGAGGGSEVLQALYHKAELIDAVELNGQMVDLMRHEYGDFAGHIYENPRVRVRVDEARGFVAASKDHYDLIQLALLDAFNASSAGLYALNESYVYTVEALREYLAHLNSGGMLAITRWIRLPPRDDVKLFATAVEALEHAGVAQPGQQLAWIRSWQTSTLLIKNGEFSPDEIAALRRFCAERSFDIVWYPGVQAEETNVYNVLKEPYFFQAATALLGVDRRSFIARYKFDIEPATDDRPYFFRFFRWPLLPELLERRGAGGLSMLDMGYLTLIAALFQAAIVSVLLILAPLKTLGRIGNQAIRQAQRRRAAVYFSAIGLAFMFMEIVYIQKFILYLAHPLYAIPVVLAGFLFFAGLGSGFAARIEPQYASAKVARAVGLIALVSFAYLILLPLLFGASMGLPAPVKIVIVLGLIAPIAFFMGLPFPLGLSRLAQSSAALIPWVWGINGCASVIAAILATLLAIHFGQTVVLLLALLMYATAVWSMRE